MLATVAAAPATESSPASTAHHPCALIDGACEGQELLVDCTRGGGGGSKSKYTCLWALPFDLPCGSDQHSNDDEQRDEADDPLTQPI